MVISLDTFKAQQIVVIWLLQRSNQIFSRFSIETKK